MTSSSASPSSPSASSTLLPLLLFLLFLSSQIRHPSSSSPPSPSSLRLLLDLLYSNPSVAHLTEDPSLPLRNLGPEEFRKREESSTPFQIDFSSSPKTCSPVAVLRGHSPRDVQTVRTCEVKGLPIRNRFNEQKGKENQKGNVSEDGDFSDSLGIDFWEKTVSDNSFLSPAQFKTSSNQLAVYSGDAIHACGLQDFYIARQKIDTEHDQSDEKGAADKIAASSVAIVPTLLTRTVSGEADTEGGAGNNNSKNKKSPRKQVLGCKEEGDPIPETPDDLHYFASGPLPYNRKYFQSGALISQRTYLYGNLTIYAKLPFFQGAHPRIYLRPATDHAFAPFTYKEMPEYPNHGNGPDTTKPLLSNLIHPGFTVNGFQRDFLDRYNNKKGICVIQEEMADRSGGVRLEGGTRVQHNTRLDCDRTTTQYPFNGLISIVRGYTDPIVATRTNKVDYTKDSSFAGPSSSAKEDFPDSTISAVLNYAMPAWKYYTASVLKNRVMDYTVQMESNRDEEAGPETEEGTNGQENGFYKRQGDTADDSGAGNIDDENDQVADGLEKRLKLSSTEIKSKQSIALPSEDEIVADCVAYTLSVLRKTSSAYKNLTPDKVTARHIQQVLGNLERLQAFLQNVYTQDYIEYIFHQSQRVETASDTWLKDHDWSDDNDDEQNSELFEKLPKSSSVESAHQSQQNYKVEDVKPKIYGDGYHVGKISQSSSLPSMHKVLAQKDKNNNKQEKDTLHYFEMVHRYHVQWTPEVLRIFHDQKLMFEIDSTKEKHLRKLIPCAPMRLVAELAIGGNYDFSYPVLSYNQAENVRTKTENKLMDRYAMRIFKHLDDAVSHEQNTERPTNAIALHILKVQYESYTFEPAQPTGADTAPEFEKSGAEVPIDEDGASVKDEDAEMCHGDVYFDWKTVRRELIQGYDDNPGQFKKSNDLVQILVKWDRKDWYEYKTKKERAQQKDDAGNTENVHQRFLQKVLLERLQALKYNEVSTSVRNSQAYLYCAPYPAIQCRVAAREGCPAKSALRSSPLYKLFISTLYSKTAKGIRRGDSMHTLETLQREREGETVNGNRHQNSGLQRNAHATSWPSIFLGKCLLVKKEPMFPEEVVGVGSIGKTMESAAISGKAISDMFANEPQSKRFHSSIALEYLFNTQCISDSQKLKDMIINNNAMCHPTMQNPPLYD
eukprot:Nk52_evm2s325 gene=Nk52_evmTU2s325